MVGLETGLLGVDADVFLSWLKLYFRFKYIFESFDVKQWNPVQIQQPTGDKTSYLECCVVQHLTKDGAFRSRRRDVQLTPFRQWILENPADDMTGSKTRPFRSNKPLHCVSSCVFQMNFMIMAIPCQ
jgi:hypothetical protein